MSVGRICTRTVHLARPADSVQVAAQRMQERGVGTLIVVDGQGQPIGIVTDRDLVIRCLAKGLDAGRTKVESVMTRPVIAVGEGTPIEDALKRMSGRSVRRLVVNDEKGRLAGILSLDDVTELLAEESQTIGRLLRQRPSAADA